MADQKEPDDTISPPEMRRWLKEEIADLTKAMQLRVTEATALVTDYAAGKITPQEAKERLEKYDRRWGEALPGASASKGVTDEEILAAIDRAAAQAPGSFETRFARGSGSPIPKKTSL